MVAETTLKHISKGGSQKMNLSFAGCGFLGIYHVGVASCIREYAPQLFSDKVSGASAGALVAAAMITNCSLGDATTYTLRIAGKARQRALGPLHPSFNIVKYLREGLETFLPENAHNIANGRLNISLTRLSDRKNVVVNQFDSKDELIQALVCSSFIPFYCGILPPKYRGVRYVDGGLSDNIPVLDDNTVSVSPFAGESDICPTDASANDMHVHLVNTSIQCTMGNLYRASYAFFPPHPQVLADTCKQGFDDALRFLLNNTLVSPACLMSIKSSVVTEDADPMVPVTLNDSSEMSSDESSLSDSEMEEDEEEGQGEEWGRELYPSSSLLEPKSDLPPSVVHALQAACDSVNKGLLAPLYNTRVFRVLSLMTAPWILPVDVAVVLAQRLYEWVPYMPSDMQWFVKEFIAIAREILWFIQHNRHKYSARFTCQLAITEFDQPTPSSTERDAGVVAVGSPYIRRRMTFKATDRHHHRHHHHHHHYHHHFPYRDNPRQQQQQQPPPPPPQAEPPLLPSARAHRAAGFNGPVRCADDLRHEILDNREHSQIRVKTLRIEECEMNLEDARSLPPDEESVDLQQDTESSGGSEAAASAAAAAAAGGRSRTTSGSSGHLPSLRSQAPSELTDTSYDQFENALEVADGRDSILAFYYTEEDNPGVVQVTEIYSFEGGDPQLEKLPSSSSGWRSRSASHSRSRACSDANQRGGAGGAGAGGALEKAVSKLAAKRDKEQQNNSLRRTEAPAGGEERAAR